MENKQIPQEFFERFAFLYYGQKVLRVTSEMCVRVGMDGWNISHTSNYLELRSLADITDEDAIELVKIKYPLFRDLECKVARPINRQNNIRVVFYRDEKPCEYSQFTEWNLEIFQIDFLRSRSYLLPFAGYSAQDWIDSGRVKIKQSTPNN